MESQETLEKIAIEGCWKLKLKDIGKGILRGKDGQFILLSGLTPIFGSFTAKNGFLTLIFSRNDKKHTQAIKLAESEAVFGTRPYFVCSQCGSRRNNLYLRPDSFSFACSECLNLYYETTRQNRRTTHGDLFYRHNRCLKLIALEPEVKRIYYNGKFTKKAASIMKQIKKIHY